MKRVIIIIFVLLTINSNAQQIYPIKETFDNILEPHYTSWGYDYYNTNVEWWQSWGWTLLSYLRLYQTTKDKAYLNKFIKHSYGLQMRRGNEIWDGCMNSNDATIVLYTGQLLRPMAEFVYIVKNDNDLYNTNLMLGLIPSSLSNPTQTVLGYGDYANWLQARVIESMDHLLDLYWIDGSHCFRKTDNNSDHSSIEINFNASYASTMFFIGAVDAENHSDYTEKAENIVQFFKNQVSEYLPNQSYTWFHNNAQTLREDVVHGLIDIQIPIVAYMLYGNGLYSPSDLNKFANTFIYNIWDMSNQNFHNNVIGTDYECSSDQTMCDSTIFVNGTVNFYSPGEVLGWMSLFPFDNNGSTPNDIYTILLTQTVKLISDDGSVILPDNFCNTTTHFLSGTIAFYGLSEVTKAQWDKECVNLTLFNRDVVYDQDFTVKNNLVVAPQQNYSPPSSSIIYYTVGDDPFAEPKIFTDTGPIDRFVIEPEKTVYMSAGNEIVLKPGFIAKAGSEFHASIDPNLCGEGRMHSNQHNSTTENSVMGSTKLIKDSLYLNDSVNIFVQDKDAIVANSESSDLTLAADIESLGEQKISVYPNPTKDNLTIKISPFDNNYAAMVAVYDLQSHLLLNKAVINEITVVDLSDLPKGSYIIRVSIFNLHKDWVIVKE